MSHYCYTNQYPPGPPEVVPSWSRPELENIANQILRGQLPCKASLLPRFLDVLCDVLPNSVKGHPQGLIAGLRENSIRHPAVPLILSFILTSQEMAPHIHKEAAELWITISMRYHVGNDQN